MKRILLVAALFSQMAAAQTAIPSLPRDLKSYSADWLVKPSDIRAAVYLSADKKDIVLYNGLVKRVFRLSPNVACIEYSNLMNGQQLLRAVKPEAVLKIDGKEHRVGGLYGQKEKAYLLNDWVDQLSAHSEDLQLKGYTVTDLKDQIQWKPAGWTPNKKSPTGKVLSFAYSSPLLPGLSVNVHYEIYDGIPLIVKYVTLQNSGGQAYKIDRVKNEILDLVEEESAVVGSPAQMKTQQGIYIETNYAFNNAMRYQISDQTTHWLIDSSYTSQVNYNYQTPCVLEVYPDKAPGIELNPGESFKSVRTYELLMDSYDRERRGLFVRKMYSKVAPWTTSNPIFMHLVSKNDEEVIRAVDQCDSTGYEAVILSFGSHLNMEDQSDANLSRWKKLTDYAHSKGIMIGGYSLFSSRRISDEDDVISPVTGKPGGAFFGNAPCFGSKWGLAYRDKIKNFFTYTGFDVWENDGPYPGDQCASTTHPGHKGLDDSQWRQMEMQKDLYRWLNEKGVYINAPDWYFLDGTHKIAIGYREVNFSLPRENQKILNRQNIFDGTWEKTPSMGWGFVPLVRYQGGGPEAVLEPLSEHLKDYEQLMIQYYGAGVQACYRGPRLYDTEKTRQTVIGVINWYKKYREILNADIVHLRRADGRDWDGWLHVNPALKQKGLMMLFNPTDKEIRTEVAVPVYYTGLHTTVKIREKEGVSKAFAVSRDYKILLPVTLQPGTYSWWILE
ncbi:MAG TPA: hypothetical protein VK166_19575 [Chitinophagaceae bacterium]|nr:hypothetical protein [Chitinophagaceae bacterium]